jgi:hypothetical protein
MVVIGTYNMSFMSDMGMVGNDGKSGDYASEATFLYSNKSENKRLFWENSFKRLKEFVSEKSPLMVGLQEMNKSLATPDGFRRASGCEDVALHFANTKYQFICEDIESPNGRPGLGMLIDTFVAGNVVASKIYPNPFQGGRPIMIAYTKNEFMFINIHGAQDPKLTAEYEKFNQYMVENNVKAIQQSIDEFRAEYLQNRFIGHLFIAGDFNDRYDAITRIDIPVDNLGPLTYQGDAPLACCHNWDSSCSEERYAPFSNPKYGTCTKKDEWTNIKTKMNYTMGTEGHLKNYRYRGDKVFGEIPSGDISIYPPVDEQRGNMSSEHSDHELVFAEFELKMYPLSVFMSCITNSGHIIPDRLVRTVLWNNLHRIHENGRWDENSVYWDGYTGNIVNVEKYRPSSPISRERLREIIDTLTHSQKQNVKNLWNTSFRV